MLKKLLRVILFLSFLHANLALAITAANITPGLPPDIAAILKSGVLRVGLPKVDQPPYSMHSAKGDLEGIDVEVAKRMANKLGVKILFNTDKSSYNELGDMLFNNQIDIVVRLTPLPERAIKLRFSLPYIKFHQALLMNRLYLSDNPIDLTKNISLKNNTTIGVLGGSYFEMQLRATFPNTQVILYKDMNKAMQDVAAGKLAGIFYSVENVHYWLNDNPDKNIDTQILMIHDREIPMALAVRWSNENFLNWANVFMENLKQSGELDTIYKKYFPGLLK